MAWGYRLSEWYAEPAHIRGKAIAHHIHRNIREAFISERMTKPNDSSYQKLLEKHGIR
jgi:hypothetical protein